jgi:hypothetical protein
MMSLRRFLFAALLLVVGYGYPTPPFRSGRQVTCGDASDLVSFV